SAIPDRGRPPHRRTARSGPPAGPGPRPAPGRPASLREPLEDPRILAMRAFDDLAELRRSGAGRNGRDDEHPAVSGDLELGVGVDVGFLEKRLVENERQAVSRPDQLLAHGTYELAVRYVQRNAARLQPRLRPFLQ